MSSGASSVSTPAATPVGLVHVVQGPGVHDDPPWRHRVEAAATRATNRPSPHGRTLAARRQTAAKLTGTSLSEAHAGFSEIHRSSMSCSCISASDQPEARAAWTCSEKRWTCVSIATGAPSGASKLKSDQHVGRPGLRQSRRLAVEGTERREVLVDEHGGDERIAAGLEARVAHLGERQQVVDSAGPRLLQHLGGDVHSVQLPDTVRLEP